MCPGLSIDLSFLDGPTTNGVRFGAAVTPPKQRPSPGIRSVTPDPVSTPADDLGEAMRLMESADELVEQLGVDGRHPLIAAATAELCSAFANRDTARVRSGVAEFMALVRSLAAGQNKG